MYLVYGVNSLVYLWCFAVTFAVYCNLFPCYYVKIIASCGISYVPESRLHHTVTFNVV